MQKFIKQSLLLAIMVLMTIIMAACGGTLRTCSDCRQDFRGNAYYGWTRSIILCEDCALDFWHPLRIDHLRVQD